MIDLSKVAPERIAQARKLLEHVEVPPAVLSQQSLLGMPIDQFAARHYYLENKRPMQLYPHQVVKFKYAFDPRNCPPYGFQTIVNSAVKKSGKTAEAGLVCRWVSETWGGMNQVYTVANDKEQNRGRIYGSILTSMQMDPYYDKARKILASADGYDRWRIIEKDLLHLPSGSIIRAIAGDHEGEAGSNPTLTAWCVDEETEILTSNGWRTYKTFDVTSDQVATRNPATGAFEWQKARAVNITPFEGYMYDVGGKQVDMLVSPNHRLWAQLSRSSGTYKRTDFDFVAVEDASQSPRTFIPDAFSAWTPSNNDEVFEPLNMPMELYARFMGWYLSEGCTHKNRSVVLGAKFGSKQMDTLSDLVREMGFVPSVWMHGSLLEQNNSVVFHSAKVAQYLEQFGKAQDKFVPKELKESKYLSTFFAAYVAGDGCIEGTRTKISTVSKQMSDDLQEIGLKLGYWVSHSIYYDERPIFKNTPFPLHNIRFYDGQEGQHTKQIRREQWKQKFYKGMIWCPSTPNGIITVRRNGKVYQSGNTEIWALRLLRDQKLWAEMVPSPTRERSIRYVETYAGYKGESNILWDLWQQAVRDGRHLTKDDVPDWPFDPDDDEGHIPFYVNLAARLFAYIDQGDVARRMPWQQGPHGEAYYQAQAYELRGQPGQFDRLHRNMWVERANAFIPIQWFIKCTDEDLLKPENSLDALAAKRTPCVVAADGSVSGDCTALMLITRHPTQHQHTAVRDTAMWTPPQGGQLDYKYTIEKTLKEWCLKYNIVHIAYDPYQLHHLMSNLKRTDLRRNDPEFFPPQNCVEFVQGAERRVSDKRLFDMIRDEQTHHDGYQTDLQAHVSNSAAEWPDNDNTRLKITKSDDGAPIDLTVTWSMGNHRCMELVI